MNVMTAAGGWVDGVRLLGRRGVRQRPRLVQRQPCNGAFDPSQTYHWPEYLRCASGCQTPVRRSGADVVGVKERRNSLPGVASEDGRPPMPMQGPWIVPPRTLIARSWAWAIMHRPSLFVFRTGSHDEHESPRKPESGIAWMIHSAGEGTICPIPFLFRVLYCVSWFASSFP